jgi:AmiR/NasT family two-component response regulator
MTHSRRCAHAPRSGAGHLVRGEPRSDAPSVGATESGRLRVLIANEQSENLAADEALLSSLGHEVLVPSDVAADEVPAMLERLRPDVALIGLGTDRGRAVDLIERIVKQAMCPVIVVTHGVDQGFVRTAATAGAFAYLDDEQPSTWRNVIELVVQRFGDYRRLLEAFDRRAVIERAKGIVMERHAVGEHEAFAMIRSEARGTNRRVVDIAAAVLTGHPLLPAVHESRSRGTAAIPLWLRTGERH